MDYRREIDGLRAIAVLPVILFHAGFGAFSGGFVGVDVFFVISGYLITTIILTELAQGNFSIVSFYERRARRILPALFLVMFVCVPFAWVLLSPAELSSFSNSLVAVPLFVSNLFFWRDGGYFETAAELKPLLHTWSLAVEEQFYVLLPLFLICFWKLGKRWTLTTLALAFFASFALAEWAAYAKPDAAFYFLPTRGWELLVGVFAAFYLKNNDGKDVGQGLSEVAGWTGVAFIFYAVFTYSKSTPFPGLYALAPTVGAALIILFATQQTSVGRFLGSKVFVGIGLISYSAYLWHQPVLAYARHYLIDISNLESISLFGLIIILSILSWKYVELPFRAKGEFGRIYVYAAAFLCAIFFISVGYFSSKINFRYEEVMAKELSVSNAIYSSNINERLFIKSRILHENINPEAIVIGSSRIMQASSKGTGLNLLNLSVSGASLEDLVAIWELSSRKFNPKYVFLGADPWIFNLNSGQARWSSLSAEYSRSLTGLGISKEINIAPLESQSYLDSTASRFYLSVNRSKITAEDDTPTLTDKIRKDGSRIYNLAYANKSSGEVEREAKSFISYAMSNYIYSNEATTILERFVAELKRQDRKVVFVLSPYHPKLFQLMTLEDKKFLKIESIFRKIAKSNNAQVIGSYDPLQVGCASDDFFDGMHPKDICMNKVFSQLSK